MLEGASEGEARRRREAQALTYAGAALTRIALSPKARWPRFEQVFSEAAPRPAQSEAEIVQIMRAWTAIINVRMQ